MISPRSPHDLPVAQTLASYDSSPSFLVEAIPAALPKPRVNEILNSEAEAALRASATQSGRFRQALLEHVSAVVASFQVKPPLLRPGSPVISHDLPWPSHDTFP